jgi:hypothetical protein
VKYVFSCRREIPAPQKIAKTILLNARRPPGNWATFSFQGRIVPTEAKPSKLSKEIL